MKKLMKKLLKKLSKETKIKDPQQINFTGELLKNTGATMFTKKGQRKLLLTLHKILLL